MARPGATPISPWAAETWSPRRRLDLDLVPDAVHGEARRHHDLAVGRRDLEPADDAPAVKPSVEPAESLDDVALLRLEVRGAQELPGEVADSCDHGASIKDGPAALA